MQLKHLVAHATAALLLASISHAAPALPSGKEAVFIGGALDGYRTTNGTLPPAAEQLWERHLQRRDSTTTVGGGVSCRALTQDDLNDLNDDQLWQFVVNMNNLFYYNVYDIRCCGNNVRKYRWGAFGSSTRKDQGIRAWVGSLNERNLAENPSTWPAQICLDASKAVVTKPYSEDSSKCVDTKLTTQGTLGDQGQVTIEVTQGYTVSSSVTTETSSTFGKSMSAGVDIGGVSVGVEVSYETSTTQGTEDTTEKSSETTVSVQINPPSGYDCYMDLTQRTCPGTVEVQVPFTSSGYILVNFDYLDPDNVVLPGMGQYLIHDHNAPNVMYYVDTSYLFGNLPGLYLTNTVSTTVVSNGAYHQHCNPQGQTSSGSGSSPGGISTAYVPELTCPKTLGVVQGACSHTLDDYIGTGDVIGDNENWQYNNAQIEQFPGTGAVVPYGQSTVAFNVSTPYHWKACQSQIQVVPGWGASFIAADPTLTLSTSGKTSTEYYVGYVSTCDRGQHGSCFITDIKSRYTPDFQWTDTSTPGSPAQSFDYTGTWPEYDRLTFTITCTDAYGNSGTAVNTQEAYRGDVATETFTLNTATQTLHSATQYLYTSVKTFLTSVVTPTFTDVMKTDTLYTNTIYTSTRSIVEYGAPKYSATQTITSVPTVTVSKTKTLSPETTPTSTITLTKTEVPVTAITKTIKDGVKTVRATSTKLSTRTSVVTLRPTQCGSTGDGRKPKQALDARKIVSTTTTTDAVNTRTVSDYLDTAIVTLAATTTSTDLDDVVSTTLASTFTYYDPIHTVTVAGVKFDAATTILQSFTVTSTKHVTSPTTTTTVRTKTSSVTHKPVTETQRTTKTKAPATTTMFQTIPSSTKTTYVKTVSSTTTSTRQVTPACTP